MKSSRVLVALILGLALGVGRAQALDGVIFLFDILRTQDPTAAVTEALGAWPQGPIGIIALGKELVPVPTAIAEIVRAGGFEAEVVSDPRQLGSYGAVIVVLGKTQTPRPTWVEGLRASGVPVALIGVGDRGDGSLSTYARELCLPTECRF